MNKSNPTLYFTMRYAIVKPNTCKSHLQSNHWLRLFVYFWYNKKFKPDMLKKFYCIGVEHEDMSAHLSFWGIAGILLITNIRISIFWKSGRWFANSPTKHSRWVDEHNINMLHELHELHQTYAVQSHNKSAMACHFLQTRRPVFKPSSKLSWIKLHNKLYENTVRHPFISKGTITNQCWIPIGHQSRKLSR